MRSATQKIRMQINASITLLDTQADSLTPLAMDPFALTQPMVLTSLVLPTWLTQLTVVHFALPLMMPFMFTTKRKSPGSVTLNATCTHSNPSLDTATASLMPLPLQPLLQSPTLTMSRTASTPNRAH